MYCKILVDDATGEVVNSARVSHEGGGPVPGAGQTLYTIPDPGGRPAQWIGGEYQGGTFIPLEMEEEVETGEGIIYITPMQAFDRLTVSERIGLRAERVTDPYVDDFFHRFDTAAAAGTRIRTGEGSEWYAGIEYCTQAYPAVIAPARLAIIG